MPGGEVRGGEPDGALPSLGACVRNSGLSALLPRPLVIALGLVLAIWLVALSRWILTDTVVPWDSKNQFYAFFGFLARTIHEGALPVIFFW